MGDTEIGVDEPAQDLDDVLFGSASGGTETAAQVTVEAVLGSIGVPALTEMGPVRRRNVSELREVRQMHRIGRGSVAGLRAS